MRVKINRNVCDAQLAFCERCLGRFLRYPEGYELRCFEDLQDDGRDILSIELKTGDQTVFVELDEESRRMIAGEGWSSLLNYEVPMYRTKTEGMS